MDISGASMEWLRGEADRLFLIIEEVMTTRDWRADPALVEKNDTARRNYSAILIELDKRKSGWWACAGCGTKNPMVAVKCSCGHLYMKPKVKS